MLKDLKVSRRFALQGTLAGAGVALWLPILDAMSDDNGEAFAQGDPLPTTFGVFYWANGIHSKYWTPQATGKGDAWQLPRNIQAFAPVKDSMTLVTGLDMMDGVFKGHGWGVMYVLAGGDSFPCTVTSDIGANPIKGEKADSTHSSPTIDQIVADDIRAKEEVTRKFSPYKSLETGMLPYTGMAMGTVSHHLAHRGEYDFLPPERDPAKLYTRLFSKLDPGMEPDPAKPGLSELTVSLRRSALDAVVADAERLKLSLGANDAERIDRHMTSIRSIEQRLAAMAQPMEPGGMNACKVPANPGAVSMDPMSLTLRSQAINRLVTAALACNLTRVYSHLWSGARDDNTYPIVNINDDHHGQTHSGQEGNERAALIEQYIMEQYADLAISMKETPLGNGTVLSHTLNYGVTEVSNPGSHVMADYHIILMGGAGGKLPGNQHIRLPKRKVTELGLTMMQTMGVQISEWGSWDRTSSTIPEIFS